MTDKEKEPPGAIPADQLVTKPSGPPLAGGKLVEVLIGPHRGSVLVMPEGEADAAINDRWAVEPVSSFHTEKPEADQSEAEKAEAEKRKKAREPLTEDQQKAAEKAAQEWAAKVNPPPKKDEGQHQASSSDGHAAGRSMEADQSGGYVTKKNK